jgi:hypothetical protein
MKSLQEFIQTKKQISKQDFITEYPQFPHEYITEDYVLLYEDLYYIEMDEHGNCSLTIDRTTYKGQLEALQEILWSFI